MEEIPISLFNQIVTLLECTSCIMYLSAINVKKEGSTMTMQVNSVPNNTKDFQDLYIEHQAALYQFLRALTKNHHDAADLLQEAFIRMYQHQNNIQPSCIKSWLFQTSYRLFVDKYRRKSKYQWTTLEVITEPECSQSSLPDVIYLHKECENKLLDDIAQLNTRERDILYLLAWEQLTYREIAERIKSTESAIKTAIFRARTKMKQDRQHSHTIV